MNDKEFKMPWSEESPFDRLDKEMKSRGFTFVGEKSLTEFKFDPADARFKTREICTKDDIIAEYGDGVEVELVDRDDLDQGQKAVLIFIKRKE